MSEHKKLRANTPLPSYYNDLDASFGQAWRLLQRGVKDRRSAFHTPVVSTVTEDGTPDVRTVVLRAASLDNALLRFHTDCRSQKWQQLTSNPACMLLGYDAQLKIQLRLKGIVFLHQADEVAASAWQASKSFSRLCYAQLERPGSHVPQPVSPVMHDPDHPDLGKENFCAVVLHVNFLEWLYLNSQGHRRAAWTKENGTWQGGWLAP